MRRGRACWSERVAAGGGAVGGKEEPEEGELRGLSNFRGMVVVVVVVERMCFVAVMVGVWRSFVDSGTVIFTMTVGG